MMATLNEGDEVVVPAPYWVSYPDIVLLAGGEPVILECNEKQGFKINPLELEKTITKKTKWIIINSLTKALVIFFARSSKLPAQPTQKSTSGCLPWAANSAMVGMLVVLSIIKDLNGHFFFN